jgi:hypothetical protein
MRPSRPPEPRIALERTLARLSADEMVAALRLGDAPRPLRALVRAGFFSVSMPLGRLLARFDRRIDAMGVSRAAEAALTDLRSTIAREGPAPPARGPLVVVSNHPGSYDTLSLLAAVGRDDVAIVASDRAFLRALPGLSRHLIYVPDRPGADALARASGLRRALRHVRGGGAIVHFGAGKIEPDPRFPRPRGEPWLGPWLPGTGLLVRGAALAAGWIVPAITRGVHSPRAKRALVTRLAERRGVTTVAALLQIAIPYYGRVEATVRFGDAEPARDLAGLADDARITEAVRERLRVLLPPG